MTESLEPSSHQSHPARAGRLTPSGAAMVKEVRDHWYWRPNWRPGRSFYTWHIVFPNDPVLTDLHAAYQGLVGSLPGISPVPVQWLHLTLQGIGFADKVPQADLDPIIEAAQRRLEHFRPFEIKLGPAVVDVESLQLPVSPVDRLRRLRTQLRAAVTDVWGRDSVPELPELYPHVSLGYWNRPAPAEPLRQRVNALSGGIARTEVAHVTLINLNRDQAQYEWTTYATLPLGEPPPHAPATRPPGAGASPSSIGADS
ncbi:2'-5' RNA ligase family protein [Kribbella shirazensis]|uniref:2'-5' RNA ligase n=1 Tax=Kribbella shirazensis TaxID=1105143 RepID=A0A7X5V899_9ACTN|nr:2'-5' RNA ligase family protein [Kribbella shirazensis]NIK56428.1 2'-5' RNA ligase [Kribbella shirazensis]